jgi:hypothetical protein
MWLAASTPEKYCNNTNSIKTITPNGFGINKSTGALRVMVMA